MTVTAAKAKPFFKFHCDKRLRRDSDVLPELGANCNEKAKTKRSKADFARQDTFRERSCDDCRMHELFHRLSRAIANWVGTQWAFAAALLVILIWIITGPIYQFSDTWQLVINTGTTIVTFLMVFLIQNTQNRDAKAVHLKLDELIRSINGARNELIDLEDVNDRRLEELHVEFQELHDLGGTGVGRVLEAIRAEKSRRST